MSAETHLDDLQRETEKLVELLKGSRETGHAAWWDLLNQQLAKVRSLLPETDKPRMKRFMHIEIKGTDIDDCLAQMARRIGPKQTIVLMTEHPLPDGLYYQLILDNRELLK